MSQRGIKRAAKFFSDLQVAKEELIRMGSEDATTLEGEQDILLGHMLRKAEDAIKDEFCELTMQGKKKK